MIDLFYKGGPLMWPLLCLSTICFAAILERLWFFFRTMSSRSKGLVEQALMEIAHGNIGSAGDLLRGSNDFVARVLAAGLSHWQLSGTPEFLNSALQQQANIELRRFQGGLSLLDISITTAPLLGLLGTVTGMIRSFGMLGDQELSAPAAITGGIAEALIATACGLGIAIVAVIPFSLLQARIEGARQEIEAACTRLEMLLGQQSPPKEVSNAN